MNRKGGGERKASFYEIASRNAIREFIGYLEQRREEGNQRKMMNYLFTLGGAMLDDALYGCILRL